MSTGRIEHLLRTVEDILGDLIPHHSESFTSSQLHTPIYWSAAP